MHNAYLPLLRKKNKCIRKAYKYKKKNKGILAIFSGLTCNKKKKNYSYKRERGETDLDMYSLSKQKKHIISIHIKA